MSSSEVASPLRVLDPEFRFVRTQLRAYSDLDRPIVGTSPGHDEHIRECRLQASRQHQRPDIVGRGSEPGRVSERTLGPRAREEDHRRPDEEVLTVLGEEVQGDIAHRDDGVERDVLVFQGTGSHAARRDIPLRGIARDRCIGVVVEPCLEAPVQDLRQLALPHHRNLRIPARGIQHQDLFLASRHRRRGQSRLD